MSTAPEFIRIPGDGERCPHTGLGRPSLRRLCVPIKANGYRPAVPAKCLREPGNLQGMWIVPYAALMAHLHNLPTPGMVSVSENAGQPAGVRVTRSGRSAGAKSKPAGGFPGARA